MTLMLHIGVVLISSDLITGDDYKSYSFRFLYFLTKSSIIKYSIELPVPSKKTNESHYNSKETKREPDREKRLLVDQQTCGAGNYI